MQRMSRPMLKKIGKRVVQLGLPIIVLGFFLYYAVHNWNALAAHPFQWNFWLLNNNLQPSDFSQTMPIKAMVEGGVVGD